MTEDQLVRRTAEPSTPYDNARHRPRYLHSMWTVTALAIAIESTLESVVKIWRGDAIANAALQPNSSGWPSRLAPMPAQRRGRAAICSNQTNRNVQYPRPPTTQTARVRLDQRASHLELKFIAL
jgi:hypothetical protein